MCTEGASEVGCEGSEWQSNLMVPKGDQVDSADLKRNANRAVLRLLHDSKVIVNSTVIMLYLDVEFPVPSLMPGIHPNAWGPWLVCPEFSRADIVATPSMTRLKRYKLSRMWKHQVAAVFQSRHHRLVAAGGHGAL